MKQSKKALGPGIRRHRNRWQANIRIDGVLRTTTFELDTLPSVMQAWREAQKTTAGPEPDPGSFAADVAEHLAKLKTVTAPRAGSYLAIWIDELGGERASASIKSEEITAVMDRWAVTPTVPKPGPRQGRASSPAGLAPGSILKRHGYLFGFFKSRFGAAGINPARGAKPPSAAKPEARAIRYTPAEAEINIADILARMPRYRSARIASATSKGRGRARFAIAADKPAKCTLIAAVIAYSGVPPGMLMDVTRKDLTLNTTPGEIRVRARIKGGGVEARAYPLGPEAVAACKAWDAANIYGSFAIQSVNRSFQRAAATFGIDPLRWHLYDLRHSFGTQVYRVTKDARTVERLMGHAINSPATVRYMAAANAEVDAAAVAGFIPHQGRAKNRNKRGKVAA